MQLVLNDSQDIPSLSGKSITNIINVSQAIVGEYLSCTHPNNPRETISILSIYVMQRVFVVGNLRKGDQKAVRCVSKIYSGLLSKKYKVPRLILISQNREKFGYCITCSLRIRCGHKRHAKQNPNMTATRCICGCWAHRGCVVKERIQNNTALFQKHRMIMGTPDHDLQCPYAHMIKESIFNGDMKRFAWLNKKYIGLKL